MWPKIRFFILVFLVLFLRNFLYLRNDFSVFSVTGSIGKYTYFSPKRDRIYEVNIPMDIKPSQLSDNKWWLFYMFSLRVDKVLSGPISCDAVWGCVSDFGLINGIRIWRFNSERTPVVYENVNSLTNEVVRRDLSKSEVLERPVEIELVNATSITGFASRLARILERQAYSVVAVNSEFENKDFGCRIRANYEVSKMLLDLPLGECQLEIRENFVPARLELGSKATQVIQYLLYGRSFKMGEY